MRVAIFAESFLPYLSGVTISTDTLARGLTAAGHQVLLVVPRPAGPVSRSDSDVAWLPSYQLPWIVPAGYRMPLPLPSGTLRAAERFRPDVVHAQSPFVSGVMARRLARRVGAPLVFTHHTRFADYGHYLGPFAGPGTTITNAYLQRWWTGCAAIITPSVQLAAEIEQRLDPGRRRPLVRVVPTGIDVAAIRALPRIDARRLAGWPEDALVVASLGRLAAEKNVFELVNAFEQAALRHPRLRLLLIGGGPEEAGLRRRAAAQATMHLTGMLPRLDAFSLLRSADLFAFASRTETQGLVLAEALACGLPVVALRGPAIAESVRDGVDGLIVASASEMAGALADLAADDERREQLASAAVSGSSRFDVARRIAEVASVYREV